MFSVVFAPLLLAGCDNTVSFSGVTTWTMFPFEQGRTWEYRSTDQSLTYQLNARIVGKPDIENSINVYTVAYERECVADNIDDGCEDGEEFRLRWSSTQGSGVRIHNLIVDGQSTTFSPPITLSEPQMIRDEFIETVTGGRTWTSTFGGVVECETNNLSGWEECGLFTLEVDDKNLESPLLATFYAAPGQGLASIDFVDDNGIWRLNALDCGTCDGVW